MPTKWVEPELFMEYKGVKIWHTYKTCDGVATQMEYWYTTDQMEDDCEKSDRRFIFDARELPGWHDPSYGKRTEEETIKYAIRKNIDKNNLIFPEDNKPKTEEECIEELARDMREKYALYGEFDNYVGTVTNFHLHNLRNKGQEAQIRFLLSLGKSLEDIKEWAEENS